MFTWLETFLVVYETKSFTLASEILFISQPTVSVHIKKLESYLETPLFIRSGNHQLIPTEQADFFYPKFQLLKEEWGSVILSGKNVQNTRKKITIACSNTTGLYLLPQLMLQLIQTFPLIDFSLVKTNSQEVIRLLENHHADIGFIEDELGSPYLQRNFLFKDEPVLCGDFSSDYWLMREDHSGNHRLHEHFLNTQTKSFIPLIVNDNEMILALLKKGIGQTILSRLYLSPDIPFKALDQTFSRSFYLLTRHINKEPFNKKVADYLLHLFSDLHLNDFVKKSSDI